MADKPLPARTALGQASEAIGANQALQDALKQERGRNSELRKQVRDLQQQVAALEMANAALRARQEDEAETPRLSMIGSINDPAGGFADV